MKANGLNELRAKTDAQMASDRRRRRKVLKEFPELWALRSRWWDSFEVRICRAPAIHFLEGGICASPDMKTVKVYRVDDYYTEVYDITITRQIGAKIESIGGLAIDSPDGLGLRELALCEINAYGARTPYFLILEEGDSKDFRITVVKPPVGKKNFAKYLQKIDRKARLATLAMVI
jgi:hypothetical protein